MQLSLVILSKQGGMHFILSECGAAAPVVPVPQDDDFAPLIPLCGQNVTAARLGFASVAAQSVKCFAPLNLLRAQTITSARLSLLAALRRMLECFAPFIPLCSRNVTSARLSLLASLHRILECFAPLIPLRSRNVTSALLLASLLLGIMESLTSLIPLTRLHKCLLQRALVVRLSWVTDGWVAVVPLRRGFIEFMGSGSVMFGCVLAGHVIPFPGQKAVYTGV